jgi:hypothetical protein
MAEGQILHTKFITQTSKGSLIKVPVILEFRGSRIVFRKSPFSLKDEIKAMAGSRWHGFDEEKPEKVWSVANCPRNLFQLRYLQGENVYEWFDRPLERHTYRRPLMPHQCDLADSGLTYHYQIWAAEMGVGKTLAAQETMEQSTAQLWYWVGPRSSLPNIAREFRIWGIDPALRVEMMTYESLVRVMDEWKPGQEVPQGVIFDEASRLKTWNRQRSQSAQKLADMIRKVYGDDGYVILMTGTPSPKSPADWWSLCEIAWPGFLREGSAEALKRRLGFFAERDFGQGARQTLRNWKDDAHKCNVCGMTILEGPHELDGVTEPEDYHEFVLSINEVAYLYERLRGLVVVKHKKDCLTLPDKRYRVVQCTPTPSTLRVAQALVNSAANSVTALTLLRELSDGFQYREVPDGVMKCPHCPDSKGVVEEWYDPDDSGRVYQTTDLLDPELVSRLEKQEVPCPRCDGSGEVAKLTRMAREVPCPKEAALKELLDENEEVGRVVVFAGFTGSVDRVVGICQREGWDVVRCDGHGFTAITHEGKVCREVAPLDYWSDLEGNPRVAFVAHPESGGMSLTLVEARMAVYWSNSFKPEYRVQSEDRIHRKGMDENLGCTIVDLIHLPTDQKVLDVIRENRRLELLTLGEVTGSFDNTVAEAA